MFYEGQAVRSDQVDKVEQYELDGLKESRHDDEGGVRRGVNLGREVDPGEIDYWGQVDRDYPRDCVKGK